MSVLSRIGEPFKVKTKHGPAEVKRSLPVFKWRRTQGMATFVRDLIDLRKPLILCSSCEAKMPRRWESRYNYEFYKGYFAECSACDWCRLRYAANMYLPVEGEYHQERVRVNKLVAEVEERERQLFLKDRRYLIGV